MTTQIWAHRGASGYMPENTLISFYKAVELKADGVELDIQLSKDGEIVVIHDEKVNRTTDHKGWVKDFTLKELKAMNANYKHPEMDKVEIPTMREVFKLLKPTNLCINIELKTSIFDYEGIEEKIIQMVKEEGFEDRVIYSSFNHYSIQRIQQLDPNAKTAFLYSDSPFDMPEYGRDHHVNALHPAAYNLRFPEYMEKCKAYGLDVNVWTVNEEEVAQMCLQYGVNTLITNYPDKMRKVVEDYESRV